MRKQAFTLIEIMVTCIILFSIGALALTRYTRLVEASRCYNAQVNLIRIHQAAEIYRVKNGSTPPSGTDAQALSSNFGIKIENGDFTYTLGGTWGTVNSSVTAQRDPGPSYSTTIYLNTPLGVGNPAVPGGEFPFCDDKKVFN